MTRHIVVSLMFGVIACGSAFAGDKYSFHENLHVDQKVPFRMDYTCDTKTTTTTGTISTTSDTATRYEWKVTLTVQEVKDGSQVRSQADVDPSSTDSTTTNGSTKKAACSFAGKSTVITQNPDNSFTNNFTGSASDDDTNILNNFISPDEDYYPDHPVAIGDTWDVSDKLSRHAELGPNDRMLSQCRLDWVKTVNGRQIAQMSNSMAAIYHEPANVKEYYEATGTFIVDMTSMMIVKADQTTTSQYKSPQSASVKLTGGQNNTFHCEYTGK